MKKLEGEEECKVAAVILGGGCHRSKELLSYCPSCQSTNEGTGRWHWELSTTDMNERCLAT